MLTNRQEMRYEYIKVVDYLMGHVFFQIGKYLAVARCWALYLSNDVPYFHTQSQGDEPVPKNFITYIMI